MKKGLFITCSVESVCTVYGNYLQGVLLNEFLANTVKGLNEKRQEDTHPVPRVLNLLHTRIISTLMSLLSEPGESRNLLFQF